MSKTSLKHQGNPLADPVYQLNILEPVDHFDIPSFESYLKKTKRVPSDCVQPTNVAN